MTLTYSQIVPFYPIEIYFTPVGLTSSAPTMTTARYIPFSYAKCFLTRDLFNTPLWSQTIDINANFGMYQTITDSRDYFPFFTKASLQTNFFINEIFTMGIEEICSVENLPGISKYMYLFSYKNVLLNTRPFLYLMVTPNIILQHRGTFIVSKNYQYRSVALKQPNDYMLNKIEVIAIYLTTFNTRIFVSPYLFTNRYLFLSAPNQNGSKSELNPMLQEQGFGICSGIKYEKVEWGFLECSVEYEKNQDIIFGGNTYQKYKIGAAWENQFYRERFGYFFAADFTYYRFYNPFSAIDPKKTNQSEPNFDLNQLEYKFDTMLMYNINRNISLRPEYDFFIRKKKGDKQTLKNRFWFHLHIFL